MLAQKLILGYGSRILSQVISMVAGIVVARLAGPTVLGTVAFGMSFVSMFQFIADFGIGSAHVKLVSEGKDLGACNATFMWMKVLLVGLLATVVVATLVVQYWILGSSFESPDQLVVVLIWLVSVTVAQVSLIPTSTFAALTEQAKQDVPAFLQSVALQVLRILAVVLGLGAIGLSGAQLLATAALAVIYFRMFSTYPQGKFDRQLARQYVRIGLPIAVVGFSSTMLEYLDRVMLQYFASAEQVGYYSAGLGFGGFIKTIGVAVGMLFFPLFSSAAARNDFDYINHTIGRFERLTYIFIMPFVITLILLSDVVIRLLLGDQFAPSGPVLAVLVGGLFSLVLNMPYGNLLTGISRLRLAAVLYVVNLVFFVALNAILLSQMPPDQRALGSALAVSVSAVVLGYSFRISVSRVSGGVTVWRSEKFLVAGILVTCLGLYVRASLGIAGSLGGGMLFGAAVLCLLYGFFFVSRWATMDDVRVMGNLLDPKKMVGYIRSEFPSS